MRIREWVSVVFESVLVACLLLGAGQAQSKKSVVRPKEIHDILVNPGMGITTFQRFNDQAIYPGLSWSEVGPESRVDDASAEPDFPETSVPRKICRVRTLAARCSITT